MGYREQVIADGAVAYWRLGETAGTVAKSEVGSFDGTISGGVTLGQAGAMPGSTAMQFDGSSGKIDIPPIATPATSSIEAWVRVSSGGTFKTIFSNRVGGSVSIFYGVAGSGITTVHLGGVPFNGIKVVNDSNWHHVVWTTNGTTSSLYVDGVLDIAGAQSTTGAVGTSAAALGYDQISAGLWLNGSLDEVAIYNRALSPQQILQHYLLAQPSYRDTVLADGAKAYWRLNDTGTLARSQVGGFDGTISSGVVRGQPGALGDGDTAMRFDGTSGKIMTAAPMPLVVTVEAWIKPTALTGYAAVASSLFGGTNGLLCGLFDAKLLCYTAAQILGNASLTVGVWHHVVYIHDGATATFYLNGVLDRSVAQARGAPGPSPTGIGISGDGTSHYFPGVIDDVAIYPTALTPQQISTHYALRLRSLYADAVLADGASLYYRLDEASGTQAIDRVSGVVGTISGGVTLNQLGALAGNAGMRFNPAGPADGRISTPVGSYSAFGTGPATIECWMRTATLGPSLPLLLTTASPHAAVPGLSLFADATSLYARARDSASVANATTPVTPLLDGRWHHVLLVVRRGTDDELGLWVDGLLVTTTTVPAGRNFTSTNVMYIGGQGSDNEWVGDIDEVAIYPLALTPAQIRAHFQLRQPTYADLVRSDGATAHWRLDELTGTLAADSIGTAHGTISGGVTLGQAGAIGGNTAMKFDGVNGKISVPNGAFQAIGTGDFSCELWLRTAAVNLNVGLLDNADAGGAPTAAAGFLVFLAGASRVMFRISAGATYYDLVPTVPLWTDDRWHHIVAVARGATTELYYDGVRMSGSGVRPAASITASLPLLMGLVTAANPYLGVLDEVALYPLALTPAQIAQHYAVGIASQSGASAGLPGFIIREDEMVRYNISGLLNPSDTVTLDRPTDAIWVGGGGNITVVGGDGRQTNIKGVPAGTLLPISARKVMATGTTATDLIMLYAS